MRVELVLPTLEIGGMERMVVSLACGLANRRHDVGVTCLNASGALAEELTRKGVRTSVVRAPTVLSNIAAPTLTAHFRSIRPDVVHTHSGAWGRAVRAAKRAGVGRTIHTIHGRLDTDPWYDIVLKRWELHHTDHVVAVSDALAGDLCHRIGAPRTKVSVLINGIDTSVFSPDATSRASSRAAFDFGDSIVFGTIARLAPVKNQAVLVDAFEEVARQLPRAMLVLVGDGPLETVLRAQAAASRSAARIRFLGVQQDTASIYRALDFFVLPSLAEGTSMSILEAMASQVAVIASPVGGNVRLLDRGHCGTLAADCSKDAVRDAMLHAAAFPTHTAQLAALARERVVREFSQSMMLDAYERLYSPGP